MSSIVDERGFNQGFKLSHAQKIRLRRRAVAIAGEMRIPSEVAERSSIRILEIGCGTGELALELAMITGAQVTGIDLSPQFIRHALAHHRHAKLTFEVADLLALGSEVTRSKYNYIVGNGILHHLYHRLDLVIPRLREQLVSGGRAVFWEPNIRNPYVFLIFKIPFLRQLARLEPDEMAFSASFIQQKFIRAGFASVKAIPLDFLLPNVPAALVPAAITIGGVLEKILLLKDCAQSVFLSAAAS